VTLKSMNSKQITYTVSPLSEFDWCFPCLTDPTRKVDVRLPGKGNSNSHGARPVHLIITRIKWIRTSGLSIKNSLSLTDPLLASAPTDLLQIGILDKLAV